MQKEKERFPVPSRICVYFLFLVAEVSFKQTLERSAVSCFVACHFVYGVVDRIKIVR